MEGTTTAVRPGKLEVMPTEGGWAIKHVLAVEHNRTDALEQARRFGRDQDLNVDELLIYDDAGSIFDRETFDG